jgi:hypothetical protein
VEEHANTWAKVERAEVSKEMSMLGRPNLDKAGDLGRKGWSCRTKFGMICQILIFVVDRS